MQTISWSNPPGFPGLASFAIVTAGAFFGFGIGLIGAALIGEPYARELPDAPADTTQTRPTAEAQA